MTYALFLVFPVIVKQAQALVDDQLEGGRWFIVTVGTAPVLLLLTLPTLHPIQGERKVPMCVCVLFI